MTSSSSSTNSSEYVGFPLAAVPFTARKIIVSQMKPAEIVNLHDCEAVKNVLPTDRSAILDINFKNFKTTIVITTPNGLSSEFELPQGALSVMKVWNPITLRNVTIQLENDPKSLMASEIVLLLSIFGFNQCKELRVYSEDNTVSTGLDYLYILTGSLRAEKMKIDMKPHGVPLAINLSSNLHISNGSSIYHLEIELLMRFCESLIIDSSKFFDMSFNIFCKHWLDMECKVKYMKIKKLDGDYEPVLEEGVVPPIMNDIEFVQSGNGWIIEREDGKKARVEKDNGFFIFTVL